MHNARAFFVCAVLLALLLPRPSAADWPDVPNVNVPLCTATGTQAAPRSVSDGAGGAIVTWEDSRSGNADIYVQRISANGVVQWTADGVALCTAADNQLDLTIASDGAGGAVVTWTDGRSGTSSDIYAQRISTAGVVQWTADGVALCTATGDQTSPAIVSDGAGGAIVTWEDARSDSYSDVYAQRISANGTIQWESNGVALCTATAAQWYPAIASDGAGGAIVSWQDSRSHTNWDVYANRISPGGTVLWMVNGVPLCTATGDQSAVGIVSDGVGGAIVTWQDGRGEPNPDVYVQRISAAGTVQWAWSVPIPRATAYDRVPGVMG